MGLDDFISDNSTSQRRRSNSSSRTQTGETEEQEIPEDEQDPFKVVTDSKDRSKVFMEESDWKETKQYIEQEMDMTVAEVMNMSSIKRHDLLHRAILQHSEDERGGFQPVKHCVVCDKEFVFPNSWTFVEIESEASCPGHNIGDVMNALSAVKSHGE